MMRVFHLVSVTLYIFGFIFALNADAPAATVVVRMMSRGPAVSKQVVSMRERRFTRVIPQTEEYSCGAAALATLLTYHFGKELSEREAIKGMIRASGEGILERKNFSLLDVKKYAGDLGYKVAGYKMKPKQLLKLKIPVITRIDIRGYSHFIVLKGVRESEAYIADPAWGNRIMDLEDFIKSWSGVILALDGPNAGEGGLNCGEKDFLPVDCVFRMKNTDTGLFPMDPSLPSAIFIRLN
ncbi:MAG: C39 family peptidase [Pseudomonadota bacterium]